MLLRKPRSRTLEQLDEVCTLRDGLGAKAGELHAAHCFSVAHDAKFTRARREQVCHAVRATYHHASHACMQMEGELRALPSCNSLPLLHEVQYGVKQHGAHGVHQCGMATTMMAQSYHLHVLSSDQTAQQREDFSLTNLLIGGMRIEDS